MGREGQNTDGQPRTSAGKGKVDDGALGNAGGGNDLCVNCGGSCKTLHLKRVSFTLQIIPQ